MSEDDRAQRGGKRQVHPWIPVRLLDEIDEFAELRGLTRNSAINVLLAKALGHNGNSGDLDEQQ